MPGATMRRGWRVTPMRTWQCTSWRLRGINPMPEIEFASREDGASILGITAVVGIFIPVELSCVEELWDAYRNAGETSGYVFLAYRDDDGRVLGYACFGPHPITEGTYDLYWIVVDPAAQGRGI